MANSPTVEQTTTPTTFRGSSTPHAMVKTGSTGYTFASNEVLAAAKTGDWENNATPSAKASIETAVAAGASSVCQTYFYIGNIEGQYTGDDVPLYDFVVMVETNLETGNQQLLFTIPADSIPARKAYVTEHLDESVSMTLDSDTESTVPLRLVYEVGPRESVTQLTNRIASGEEVTSAEIEEVLGSSATKNASGQYLLYTNAFEGSGASAVAETVMSAVAASTNSYYSFTQDTPLYTLAAELILLRVKPRMKTNSSRWSPHPSRDRRTTSVALTTKQTTSSLEPKFPLKPLRPSSRTRHRATPHSMTKASSNLPTGNIL